MIYFLTAAAFSCNVRFIYSISKRESDKNKSCCLPHRSFKVFIEFYKRPFFRLFFRFSRIQGHLLLQISCKNGTDENIIIATEMPLPIYRPMQLGQSSKTFNRDAGMIPQFHI